MVITVDSIYNWMADKIGRQFERDLVFDFVARDVINTHKTFTLKGTHLEHYENEFQHLDAAKQLIFRLVELYESPPEPLPSDRVYFGPGYPDTYHKHCQERLSEYSQIKEQLFGQ